eukprot:358762-Hanusia_phi.AAC.1
MSGLPVLTRHVVSGLLNLYHTTALDLPPAGLLSASGEAFCLRPVLHLDARPLVPPAFAVSAVTTTWRAGTRPEDGS